MGFLFFPMHVEYGAPLGGPSGRRSSAIISFSEQKELHYAKLSYLAWPGAIIGDGDRKRALILLLGLSP